MKTIITVTSTLLCSLVVSIKRTTSDLDTNDDDENIFFNPIKTCLIYTYKDKYYLHVPLHSYTKPRMGRNFILHVTISMGGDLKQESFKCTFPHSQFSHICYINWVIK